MPCARSRMRASAAARPAADDEAEMAPASDEPAATPARDEAKRESEAEAERRRRRRGRRGGRTRPRRDEPAEDAAVAASGSHVAAETIEVVATGEEEQIRHEAEMTEAP